MQACEGCGGMGWIDIGDCEDGVIDNCPVCDGAGEIMVDEELIEIAKEAENAKTENQMPKLR